MEIRKYFKQKYFLKLFFEKENFSKLSDFQREELDIFLVREEVKKVVWCCEVIKVLGYEGYNMGFV